MDALRARLHWLMGLRVTFVTLMLGVSVVFEAAGTRVETFYALIVLTYALTIPSALLLRFKKICRSPADRQLRKKHA